MDNIGPSMFSALAGMSSTAESLFGRPQFGPSPEEMEAARERVMYEKHVAIEEHKVRLFDMHLPKDVKAYEKLMMELMLGVQAGTHYLWNNHLQVLNTPKGQKWFRYMEWSRYSCNVKHVAPIGAGGS